MFRLAVVAPFFAFMPLLMASPPGAFKESIAESFAGKNLCGIISVSRSSSKLKDPGYQIIMGPDVLKNKGQEVGGVHRKVTDALAELGERVAAGTCLWAVEPQDCKVYPRIAENAFRVQRRVYAVGRGTEEIGSKLFSPLSETEDGAARSLEQLRQLQLCY